MNEHMLHSEISDQATFSDSLASSIEFTREAMTLHVGYPVEVAGTELVERDGKHILRIYWHRKPVLLRLVSD
jgi:hypothetical protein